MCLRVVTIAGSVTTVSSSGAFTLSLCVRSPEPVKTISSGAAFTLSLCVRVSRVERLTMYKEVCHYWRRTLRGRALILLRRSSTATVALLATLAVATAAAPASARHARSRATQSNSRTAIPSTSRPRPLATNEYALRVVRHKPRQVAHKRLQDAVASTRDSSPDEVLKTYEVPFAPASMWATGPICDAAQTHVAGEECAPSDWEKESGHADAENSWTAPMSAIDSPSPSVKFQIPCQFFWDPNEPGPGSDGYGISADAGDFIHCEARVYAITKEPSTSNGSPNVGSGWKLLGEGQATVGPHQSGSTWSPRMFCAMTTWAANYTRRPLK